MDGPGIDYLISDFLFELLELSPLSLIFVDCWNCILLSRVDPNWNVFSHITTNCFNAVYFLALELWAEMWRCVMVSTYVKYFGVMYSSDWRTVSTSDILRWAVWIYGYSFKESGGRQKEVIRTYPYIYRLFFYYFYVDINWINLTLQNIFKWWF